MLERISKNKSQFRIKYFFGEVMETVQDVDQAISEATRIRIRNELKQIKENPPSHWKVIANEKNIFEWSVWITAQVNIKIMKARSPFHSLPFELKIKFPPNYPNSRASLLLQNPKRFFHPNISPSSGAICQKAITSISSSLTIRDKINAFVILLSNPNPDDPFNVSAALMYNHPDKSEYHRTALMKFRGMDN